MWFHLQKKTLKQEFIEETYHLPLSGVKMSPLLPHLAASKRSKSPHDEHPELPLGQLMPAMETPKPNRFWRNHTPKKTSLQAVDTNWDDAKSPKEMDHLWLYLTCHHHKDEQQILRGFHHSSTSFTLSFSLTTISDFPSSSSSTKKIQQQKNINDMLQISPPTSAQNGPLPNPKWPAKGFSSVRSQPSGGVARHLDGFWCFGVFKTWWFKYQVFHCRQTSKLA